MKLNIDTKTKNLILMIASIVIVVAFLILPFLSTSYNSESFNANGLDMFFDADKIGDVPALATIGGLLIVAGGGIAIYFSIMKNKQFFMYSAIGAAVGAIFVMMGFSDQMKIASAGASAARAMGISASAGYGLGLWLSLIASAVCIAGCFVKANDE